MNRFTPPTAATAGDTALANSAGVDTAGPSSLTGSGRETGGVSELPPPPPAGGPTPPPAPAAATGGGSGWDWDRAKDMAEAWFRPIAHPKGWWALGYLFFSTLASPFLFAAMVAVAAVAFGLSFVFVGLLLVVPFFMMVE